jgi:hypothetical protein
VETNPRKEAMPAIADNAVRRILQARGSERVPEGEAKQMRELRDAGYSKRCIARKLGRNDRTVRRVLLRFASTGSASMRGLRTQGEKP